MPYSDLRDWIMALERAGELKRVKAPVDPILEITEITDRVSKSGGPALLFENVKGHPGAQVLINQFGSARRMNMALGADSLDEIAERIRGLLDVKTPQGLVDKLKMLPMLAEMGAVFPKTVGSGPCKEVIRKKDFSVLDFPVLQCWPEDAGRFITLPCVITRDPRTGKRNVGMYRMQVFDGQTLGMHWQRQKLGAEHYREQLRRAASVSTGEGARASNNQKNEGGRTATDPKDVGATGAAPVVASERSAAVDIMARTGGGSISPEGP